MGTEMFRADRRTDMTKLIVAFTILRTHLKTAASRQTDRERERERENIPTASVTLPSTTSRYVNLFHFSHITSDVTKCA